MPRHLIQIGLGLSVHFRGSVVATVGAIVRIRTLGLFLLVLALLVSACSDSDSDDNADDGDTTTTASEASDTTVAEDSRNTPPGNAVGTPDCPAVPLKQEGVLTVATGEAVYPPWMEDDNPGSGDGFESALVYEIAGQLGLSEVVWVRTGFDEAITAGKKDYDFNIQQYSITEDRDKVVDFSDPYYTVQQALIGVADGPLTDAKTIAELADSQLGAAVGSTSLDYIDKIIAPKEEAMVYDDNAAAAAAFAAKQVDGIVVDLPTAYYLTSGEIPDSTIIGTLPEVEDKPEQLGMLFEEGSPLVPCVNAALDELTSDGQLDLLQTRWLAQDGAIPEITQ